MFLHLNMFLAGREAERCRLLQLRCRKYSRRNSFQVYFHNFRVLSRSMHINEHQLHLSVSLYILDPLLLSTPFLCFVPLLFTVQKLLFMSPSQHFHFQGHFHFSLTITPSLFSAYLEVKSSPPTHAPSSAPSLLLGLTNRLESILEEYIMIKIQKC